VSKNSTIYTFGVREIKGILNRTHFNIKKIRKTNFKGICFPYEIEVLVENNY